MTLGTSLSIQASQVSVVVRLVEGNPPDLLTLKNTVEDIVRTASDALGYVTGRGYDIEITSVSSDSGDHQAFGIESGAIAASAGERPVDPAAALELALTSNHLSRALEELREAIRSPARTAAHCFSAIEALRQSFAEASDESTSPSWLRLRESLRVERGYIAKLEEAAQAQRHGDIRFMSDKERADAMLRAWRIVDRFCIYLREGKVETDNLSDAP